MSTALMESASVRVRHEDEASWLLWRTEGIGASECAAALGISPYATPWELYQRKTGALPPIEPNDAMEIGLLMEPVVASLYERRTGRGIGERQVSLASRVRPWLRATLDGIADDGRPVEFKAVGARMAREWGEPGTDEAPPHYLCQVHQQLIVSGAEVADLAVLIGGQDFRVYTIERDPEFEGMILPRLQEFWGRIERGDPPPPSPLDAALVCRMAPGWAEAIELGDGEASLADLYRDLGDEIKALEQRRIETKASLILAMNDCAFATLPDGRRISRKPITRKEHTVKESTYIDFRLNNPKAKD
jgi:putative phage-type endonuclease